MQVHQAVAQFEAETERAADGGSSHPEHPTRATSEALSLRRQQAECVREIQRARDQVADHLLVPRKSVKIIFDAEDEYFPSASRRRRRVFSTVLFRVTKSESHRILKAEASSTKGDHSLAVTLVRPRRVNGVWFTTTGLQDLAARWSAIRHSLCLVEQRISTELFAFFRQVAPDADLTFERALHDSQKTLAELDVLAAFAVVSKSLRFVRPSTQVFPPQELVIEGIRDPCAKFQSSNLSVALNGSSGASLLAIHSGIDESHASLLKRIMCCVILHQVGCFVPCAAARLSVKDALVLRVGAEDRPQTGASTFSQEMSDIADMLRQVTPQSLFVVDELCRGTSTAEGLALAVAICRFLRRRPSVLACVATQWTELLDALLAADERGDDVGAVTLPVYQDSQIAQDNARTLESLTAECDANFISLLHDCDAPTAFVEMVADRLTRKSGTS
ncbi:hypothetical protein PINS_up007839 [Pythium insidiosum]|nr:hypothetical protein PINS_up007839 [Pythium insidiosum]